MKTAAQPCITFEFSFPRKATYLQVEIRENAAVVRATQPSFSGDQKTAFVHHLIAEGFVPAHIRNEISPDPMVGAVQWVIDNDWLEGSETIAAKSRRMVMTVLCSSGVLWGALVAFLFLRE